MPHQQPLAPAFHNQRRQTSSPAHRAHDRTTFLSQRILPDLPPTSTQLGFFFVLYSSTQDTRDSSSPPLVPLPLLHLAINSQSHPVQRSISGGSATRLITPAHKKHSHLNIAVVSDPGSGAILERRIFASPGTPHLLFTSPDGHTNVNTTTSTRLHYLL